jgi:hypothetical protein
LRVSVKLDRLEKLFYALNITMPQKMNSGKRVLGCGDARYDVTGQCVEPRWFTEILMAKKKEHVSL